MKRLEVQFNIYVKIKITWSYLNKDFSGRYKHMKLRLLYEFRKYQNITLKDEEVVRITWRKKKQKLYKPFKNLKAKNRRRNMINVKKE